MQVKGLECTTFDAYHMQICFGKGSSEDPMETLSKLK
jgi:hypothetical protein